MSKPRTTEPERCLGVICFEMPDDALDAEHPARVLWQVLGTLDLGRFLSLARAVEGHGGRPTHSPEMVLALWTHANKATAVALLCAITSNLTQHLATLAR